MVTFFFPDVVGGVFSVVNNLVKYAANRPQVIFVAYSSTDKPRKKTDEADAAAPMVKCTIHGEDNLHYTSRQLRAKLPVDTSCIVATDSAELMMVQLCKLNLPVVYIVLGDFEHYYAMAEIYSGVINKFVCISSEIFDKLSRRIPHRQADIHLAYFPTPAVQSKRRPQSGPPHRIIYVARLEEGKNPLIVNVIDDCLLQQNISVQWEIVGDGPLKASLQKLTMNKKNFNFHGFLDNEALHKLYIEQDIFILPSKSEGLPVSLIEAMKTGLVPVVSNLKGGIRDVVQDDLNGFLCDYENAASFAGRIALLYNDVQHYNEMAGRAIQSADSLFDPVANSGKYWQIIENVSGSDNPRQYNPVPLSFLDKSWLPNGLVRWMRKRKTNSFISKP